MELGSLVINIKGKMKIRFKFYFGFKLYFRFIESLNAKNKILEF